MYSKKKGVFKLPKDKTEFELIVKDMMEHNTVQQMDQFRQHYDTSCYEHCVNVSYISYRICKKLKLDYKSAARAAMVHDLFLYDWRKRQDGRKGLHGFTHPKTSLENAQKIFELSKKEQDIILKHMWPLTIKFPRYTESWVVTFVDKYCALSESFNHYFKKIKS